ncbi:phosphotransferase [Microbacterium sp. YY-01]|uniref:phosphotransferase n=1 Tax=Microbacterium sp. YY-01 TaxID=3421634 RepID=UPI003D1866C8
MPSDLAGPPHERTPIPESLRGALESWGLGSAHLRPVWQNSMGGLTFAVAPGGAQHPVDYYAKWNPLTTGESLADEAERLAWLAGKHPAPQVVALTSDAAGEVLLTHALAGDSAVSARWQHEPETALRALGHGLRQLHEVAIDQCPYSWRVEERQRHATTTAVVGAEPPSIDKLVLCQGDPCAPNTLIDPEGEFLAHVDLARLGVADRWADLAVMSMSLEWNYRDYDEQVFWDAYGIDPDRERLAYYRDLWNAEE